MAFDSDEGFSFGDFKFSPPLQSTINGVTSTSKNDALWSDFSAIFSPSPNKSQNNSSIDGLFTTNSIKPTSGLSSIRVDSSQINAPKNNGGLPLSLFGEIDGAFEGGSKNKSDSGLIGLFDPNPSLENGKLFENHKKNDDLFLNFNDVSSVLIVGNGNANNNAINENNDDDDDDEDDEWEFKVAFSSNDKVDQGNLKGGSVVNGSNLEPLTMMNEEKQAGQDSSKSGNLNLDSINYLPQSTDLFAPPYSNGANHQSSNMDIGFTSSTNTTNGFMWDPFPVVENTCNENGLSTSSINEDGDDFDEFGDFVDAFQEVASKEQEPVVAPMNLVEPQKPNGEVQEKQTQVGQTRGALPLSFFGDETEEPNDININNEVVHTPTINSTISFNGQSSAISIQDLISNLYSQAQVTSSNSFNKPVENGAQFPSNSAVTSLNEDEGEDWDNDSWEFKGVISQNMGQKESEIFPDLQSYTEFYDQLRDSLCLLLSCQLDELKKAQNSDVLTVNGEKAEALDDEIQEAFKLLEESVISKEVLSKELDRYNCLNKFVEVLQRPKLSMIESDFSLLKRLQLATNEWRVTVELLRHAISIQKVISLRSVDEQSLYATTWSKILNVCIKELRFGSSIWKRTLENNVQHLILSDSRGQKYILALGETYKVVALLRLSTKVYKPWILQNVSESSQIFPVLDECYSLWSNSGLEEAIRNLSDNVTLGCSENAKTIIASIKNIPDIDVFAMHDRVLTQHVSRCRLSLLPLELMDDSQTAIWGEGSYFLSIANLWANLISRNPPKLPHLGVS